MERDVHDCHRSPLLTLRETAAILHFSERTVRRLIADGRLRAVQPAGPRGPIRIPRDELERLVTPEGPEAS
jgi:excisionase family DNA binding protein